MEISRIAFNWLVTYLNFAIYIAAPLADHELLFNKHESSSHDHLFLIFILKVDHQQNNHHSTKFNSPFTTIVHILKLIFEHDIPLDRLNQSPNEIREATKNMSLEDFLRPQPVFSHFYISGTILGGEPRFGLSELHKVEEILTAMGTSINRPLWLTPENTFTRFEEAIHSLEVGGACTGPLSPLPDGLQPAASAVNSGDPDVVAALQELLKAKAVIVYKEKAHHGWDLHLYSLHNLYPFLFKELKPFLSDELRFFSMNGKKVRSERMFYFETWALDRPPHGVEEVFDYTEI